MAGFFQDRSRACFASVAAAIAIAALVPGVAAAELYKQPTLVADPGLHTGVIRSAAVDKDGQFLVTGSEDKTVRVWSVGDGKLSRTIRIPAGPGYVGAIFTVAMSPEGDLIAAGGWTLGILGEESIYLFDRRTGAMVKRIGSLPDVVNKLVFSLDGRYLMAAVTDFSLRLYDRDKGWAEVFQTSEYGDTINGAAFAKDGRFATTSYDGNIRLYGPDFKLIVPPHAAPGGKQPHGIAFNPTRNVLAVGYLDAADVSLLAGDTLEAIAGPNVDDLTDGLPHVAWSKDGRTLFAGRRDISAWSEVGQGPRRVLQGGKDTLMSLNPLPDGGVLITSADPLIKRFPDSGGVATSGWTQPPHDTRFVDLGNQSGILAVSEDGKIVDFGFGYGTKARLRFDVNGPRLTADPPADNLTFGPKKDGLPIERRSDMVFFQDELIEIDKGEKVRATATSADNSRFVIGGSWSLRARNSSNVLLWRRDVPDVWAVNVVRNGKLVVASYDDGTIRWHDMDNRGQEVLTLLILIEPNKTPDKWNWVAWTPDGFYGATSGAIGVLQWHLNEGPDAAGRTIRVSDVPKLHRPKELALVLQERGIGAFGAVEAREARAAVQKAAGSAVAPGARLHVLAIGISKYGEAAKNLELKYAHKDAFDLAAKLLSTQDITGPYKGSGGLYAEVKPIPLQDSNASKSNIMRHLARLHRDMAKDDTAIILFAGHGMIIEGEFYLLPHDADMSEMPATVKSTAIKARDFQQEIAKLAELGRVLVLLDACHSGALAEDKKTAPNADVLHAAMARGNLTILTSSKGDQLSREDDGWQNGAFTKVLLEALSGTDGVDANRNGLISMAELGEFLAEKLPSLTKDAQHLGLSQSFQGNLFSTGL